MSIPNLPFGLSAWASQICLLDSQPEHPDVFWTLSLSIQSLCLWLLNFQHFLHNIHLFCSSASLDEMRFLGRPGVHVHSVQLNFIASSSNFSSFQCLSLKSIYLYTWSNFPLSSPFGIKFHSFNFYSFFALFYYFMMPNLHFHKKGGKFCTNISPLITWPPSSAKVEWWSKISSLG